MATSVRASSFPSTSIGSVTPIVKVLLKAGVIPLLIGKPGIGKSSLTQAIAKSSKLKVIDVRLADYDPTDINGFPMIDQERKKAAYFPLDVFPTDQDEIPLDPLDGKPYNGWLLILDEITNCSPAVQSACYKLMLDRAVGQHKLHPKVHIIAAGNGVEDGATAQPMSSAMVSRVAILHVHLDSKEWMSWAESANINFMVTAYLKFRPDHTYNFDANKVETPYACPRTWEKLSDSIPHIPNDMSHKQKTALICSLVGEAFAGDFLTFLEVQKELPTFEQVCTDKSLEPPKDPSTRFAVMGMIASRTDATTLAKIVPYISKLTEDLQVVFLSELHARNRDLIRHPDLKEFKVKLAQILE